MSDTTSVSTLLPHSHIDSGIILESFRDERLHWDFVPDWYLICTTFPLSPHPGFRKGYDRVMGLIPPAGRVVGMFHQPGSWRGLARV